MERTSRLGIVAVLVVASGPAGADPIFEGPITDNTYAIDFYEGIAIGNTAQVGMGGAGVGLVVGTAGTLLNPSAPAVRQTTDTDTWSWDYHFDFLTATFSSDYDNNGTSVQDGAGPALFTGGIGGRVRDWAAAFTISGQVAPIENATDPMNVRELSAQALRAKAVVATWLPQIDLAIGLGVQTVTFQMLDRSTSETLFRITGAGAEAGATWIPRLRNFRIGGAIEAAINGGKVESSCGDPTAMPLTCESFILPGEIESPGRVIVGGAYRFSETHWNQLVGGVFRDEPSLTLAADVVFTGATPNGYGIEAFGFQQLQRSGRRIAVSVRGGAEYEWLPGRLRLRAGSYWEPQRFDGVGGRLHGTFGAEVRVFEFQLWGRRRGRIGLTADVASAYRNIAVSIGFWH